MSLRFLTFLSILITSQHVVAQDAVDGDWGQWMTWTTCSATCDSGYHVRQRMCDSPAPINGGQNCTGLDYETKHCFEKNCPISGEWGTWLDWSHCTVTCGLGVTYRIRKCDNPHPQYGGDACPGISQEFGKCVENPCPINGSWSNWSPYSSCSHTCGIFSIRTRNRNCSNPMPQFGGYDCEGNSTTEQKCDFVDCKDGTWSDWATWGDCSASCGQAVRFRFRKCTHSASQGSCVGKEFESSACTTPCPVAGFWGSWSRWGPCSVTCDIGNHTRSRYCDDPPPQFGGPDCNGAMDETQVESCDMHVHCPRHGNWGAWSNWTACDITCGGGRRFRLRKCDNPSPLYGGNTCPGLDIETDACNTQNCPRNGSWSNWFPWSSCSTTCGTGSMSRVRTCSNPTPAYGGLYCDGDLEETKPCTINIIATNCTLDGGWSSWGPYGDCSVTCENGTQTRLRTCTNPAPHGGGLHCPGSESDSASCTVPQMCPQPGGWSEWRAWFPCSVTCGDGQQTRIRTCTNPKPQHGGDFCSGDQQQDQSCTMPPCSTAASDLGNVVVG